MTDTMEVAGVVYGAPIDGIFDGDAFPEGLNKGDKVLVHWSHQDSGYFGGPYDVGSVWATLSGAQFRAPINHPIYGDGYGPEIKVDGMPIWLADDEQVIGKWTEWYFNGPTFKRHYASPSEITAIRLPADHWAYPVIAKGFEPWAGGDEAPGDWAPYGEVLFADGVTYSGNNWAWDKGGFDNAQDRDGALIIGYRRRVEPVSELVDTEFKWAKGDYIVAVNDEMYGITNGCVYVLTEDADAFVKFNDDDGDDRVREKNNYRPATPEEIAAYKRAFYTVTIPKMTEDEVRGRFMAIYDHSDNHSCDDVVELFKQLGIVKPEPTPIEKFEAHHGGLDDNQRAILEIYQEWIAAQ